MVNIPITFMETHKIGIDLAVTSELVAATPDFISLEF